MAHTETRTYSSSPSEVVMAVRQAASQLGWKVRSEDPTTWVMFLSTKVSLRSWGEHVTVSIRALEEGSSVDITVSLRGQLAGWGAQKRSALSLADALSRILASP